MPKRTDIQSILIIGSGPIIIGQACEFDYSGAQAIKALKEEGYKVILVNSNPATIMTDPKMADKTYIEPITWQVVEKIIKAERPDAILATMGGQTALNCALDLSRNGVLAKYNVELIGANEDVIDKAEDRGRFKQAMAKIGLNCPKSIIAHNMQQALDAQQQIGFPTLIRPSFTMGGSGGGIAYNNNEFREICERGFEASPTNELLIEQSVLGWKEYEMEVVRDKNDNCIIICSIENFDPMGVHTGDSITVAPAQTLTDKEYQLMRNSSIAVLREIGVETGGSNVQFAINPDNGEMIVIEMNPRVSRSSALASKATGFPIAKIAAKLAVGYNLDELENDITGGIIPASFEPSIDYVVTKIPRFTFEKFPQANNRLTTQMKSVGEVMAIGRSFSESLQKALRGLELNICGFNLRTTDDETMRYELSNAGADRILYVADALANGWSLDEVFSYSKIDRWFLSQIKILVDHELNLEKISLDDLDHAYLFELKRLGFSDKRIGELTKASETAVRNFRLALGIKPVYKRVDTCSGEFSTQSSYLYSTYEQECEAMPSSKQKIMILGGGPNRIGQGIEFDYCCVHASMGLREAGFETIMVNCNPETVSTDFDISDRLYFEPLTLEDVLNIIDVEQPFGVIVHYGGQTPLKLAQDLHNNGVNIIGTSADSIDMAEDRKRFGQILQDLHLKQPNNKIAYTQAEAKQQAQTVGYPLVVRPSYVLGGRAMQIVYNEDELNTYMQKAVSISNNSPILLDHFLDNAIEIDVDCICDGNDVYIGAIMQHIEQAGIHSGDSACCLPPYTLNENVIDRIKNYSKNMALALKVVGLMNVQFALKDDEIYILEVNPRASRTVPFVSKATGVELAKIAACIMASADTAKPLYLSDYGLSFNRDYCDSLKQLFYVKEAVFPFNKFPDANYELGPEMRSTGEVMGVGESFASAFLKAQIGAGVKLPQAGSVFISVADADKKAMVDIAKSFLDMNFKLSSTRGTAKYLTQNLGLNSSEIEVVNKVREGRPNIIDKIKNDEISFIINTIDSKPQSLVESRDIRQNATGHGIALYTTVAGAYAISQALPEIEKLKVYALQS